MDVIAPIGLITNSLKVQAEQTQAQRPLREAEQQTFNPNVSGHTNPSIRDPGKVFESISPKNAPSGDFNNVANPNTSHHTNPSIRNPGAVVADNTAAIKERLGNKVHVRA
jgi:hypothetical protein